MVKEDVMLNNKTGLHARPATEIAKTAMSYKSDITFLVNDKKINAKSPLMLMAAGIKSKTEIEIICNGEDEKEALENNIPARKLEYTEDDLKILKAFNLLTMKPIIYVANIKEDEIGKENIVS